MELRVAPLNELPDGRGVRLEVKGHRMALFRMGDEVYAVGDRCSHAEASLAEGELFDTTVECPRHGSEFDLQTGKPTSLPATKPIPVYHVEVREGEVVLQLDAVEETI